MTSSAVESALSRYPTVQVSYLALREGNRKRPVYTMHKWWARRSGAVFRMILLAELCRKRGNRDADLWSQFYGRSTLPDGFTVLDPFLGGGTTLIEAAKQGANCIGADIDPVACFITKLELARIDPKRIQERFEEIRAEVEATLAPLYQTMHCGKAVDVVHFFWVDRVSCPGCGKETDAHPTFQLAYNSARKRQTVICRECNEVAEKPLSARWHECACGARTDLKAAPVLYGKFTCPNCSEATSIVDLCSKGAATPRLFALEYLTATGSRDFKRITSDDLAIYQRAVHLLAQQRSKLPIPKATIPSKGRSDRRPLIYGVRQYMELFNDRQLLGLGLIARAVMETKDLNVRQALALAFSHCLASNNMLCGWAFGYRRLTPLFGVHAYRKVTRPVEGHLFGLKAGRGSFGNAVRAVVRGCEYMVNPFEYRYLNERPSRIDVALPGLGQPSRAPSVRVLNRSSVDLSPIETGVVDLVLTDPPYFDNLSYSELSDFYHVWLRKLLGSDYVGHGQPHTPIGGALFGGKRAGMCRSGDPKDLFRTTLTKVFTECHRVLRPEGALVFTFHHKSVDAWEGLGKALLTTGFVIDEVVPVRSEGQSGFHSYEGTIKWDSIFFCRPRISAKEILPSPRVVKSAARRATATAHFWTTRIRGAGFEFSAADRSSLAMSLVLREFSRRGINPMQLADALVNAQPSEESTSPQVREQPQESD
jgi:putative DNA methylase